MCKPKYPIWKNSQLACHSLSQIYFWCYDRFIEASKKAERARKDKERQVKKEKLEEIEEWKGWDRRKIHKKKKRKKGVGKEWKKEPRKEYDKDRERVERSQSQLRKMNLFRSLCFV